MSVSVQNYLKKVKNQVMIHINKKRKRDRPTHLDFIFLFKAKSNFDMVCAHPTMIVDTMSLLSSNPSSLLFKRQLTDSYTESKEFNNWLQNNLDPMRADLIRQQFADYNNFLICVREKRKTKPISYK